MFGRRTFVLLGLVMLVGCMASAPRAAAAPDLAGAWDFTVDLGTTTTPGSMDLVRNGAAWTGELRAAGPNTLRVSSATLANGTVDLAVESPEGQVTFHGTMDASGDRIAGEVVYHGGRRYPMVITRRRASGAMGAATRRAPDR